MKRTTLLSAFLACGLLGTGTPLLAQSVAAVTPSARDWVAGKATVELLGRDDVESSKYQEYRDIPKGLTMPVFSLQGSKNDKAFALFGENISRTDQRYRGSAAVGWIGVAFDYNQIPHNMGNNGQSILTNSAPGVWSMSSTLRGAIQTAIDTKMPTTTRTYQFWQDVFAPTIASASVVDVTGLRGRGNYEVDLGGKLPFDLKMTYMRDVRSGARGSSGSQMLGGVALMVEVAEPLNEVTQDAGFKFALNRSWGNVHAGFNHNWYDNRQETNMVDNPYRATDRLYTGAVGSTVPPLGGAATIRFVGPPDNAANTGSVGALIKLPKQTRITADVVSGQWTQNAQLYPYTNNTAILTPAGLRADSLTALQVQSANGKINSQTVNVGLSTRPVDRLGLRVRYRTYDMDNQTAAFVRTGNAGSNPDRNWSVAPAPTAEAPFGWPTASPYGSTSKRFDVQGSYDLKPVTIEGAYRNTQLERTYREATKGTESGASIAAIVRGNDMLLFRGVFDKANRTASGYDPAHSIGLQADESERDTTRVGIDLELMPNDQVGFLLAYGRRNNDYPNRPNRVSGVANTSNGLLSASYDTYTAEIDLTPSARVDLSAYYTYEKNLQSTRVGAAATGGYPAASAQVSFDGSDKTNTFGVNANLVLVPESYASGVGKWTATVDARRQKLDGLVEIASDPNGSFALARLAYGGIQNINDYDDTELMNASVELDYTAAESWDVAFGYAYEKYDLKDAYSDGTVVDPGDSGRADRAVYFLKANDNPYKVNVVYVKLKYRF